MITATRGAGALTMGFVLCLPLLIGQAAEGQIVHPDQWIVVLKDDADSGRLLLRHRIQPDRVYRHALNGFAGRIPAAVRQRLAADPDVAYMELDLVARTLQQTTPTGVQRVNAHLNPFAGIDGTDQRVDVDVAILDTGIDLTHPDLNVVANVTFVRNTLTGNDDHGHGTHVAGTVAALDNDFGVVGVAPGARLWAVKVLSAFGAGSFSNIIAGIDYVTANADQIEVANMSLGGIGRLNALQQAIQKSVSAGVVYVVAAGNEARDIYGPDGTLGTFDDSIPAAYPEVATVSAIGDTDGLAGGLGPNTSRGTLDDTFADFSNFCNFPPPVSFVSSPGGAIDVAAPGVDILSTFRNGQYATFSGTSMAAPHVAGAVALYIAENGRAYDAAGVYVIRQAIIDLATEQSLWGQHDPGDRDGFPEPLLDIASGDVPALPMLQVEVFTKEPTYTNLELVTIMVEVSDGVQPVADANVLVSLTSTSGDVQVLQGGTDATGLAVLQYRLFARRDSRGEFTVTASAGKASFAAGSGTTTFVFE
jgi:subtilisin family serine protease